MRNKGTLATIAAIGAIGIAGTYSPQESADPCETFSDLINQAARHHVEFLDEAHSYHTLTDSLLSVSMRMDSLWNRDNGLDLGPYEGLRQEQDRLQEAISATLGQMREQRDSIAKYIVLSQMQPCSGIGVLPKTA